MRASWNLALAVIGLLVSSTESNGAAPHQRPGVSIENGIGTVETADPRPRVIVKGDDVQAGVTQFHSVPVYHVDSHKADDAQETTPTRDQHDDVLAARTEDVTTVDVVSVAPEGNTGVFRGASDPWRNVVVATSSVLLGLWLLGGLMYCACRCRRRGKDKSLTYPGPWYLRHNRWAFSRLSSSDSPTKMPVAV